MNRFEAVENSDAVCNLSEDVQASILEIIRKSFRQSKDMVFGGLDIILETEIAHLHVDVVKGKFSELSESPNTNNIFMGGFADLLDGTAQPILKVQICANHAKYPSRKDLRVTVY